MDFVKEHLETQKMINFGDSQDRPNNIELEILADAVYVRVSLDTNITTLLCLSAQKAIILLYCDSCGGVVDAWLVDSSPDRAVRVRSLAEDIVLCSWARYFTLTVPLSNKCLGVALRWTSILSRGSRILLVASCNRHWR